MGNIVPSQRWLCQSLARYIVYFDEEYQQYLWGNYVPAPNGYAHLIRNSKDHILIPFGVVRIASIIRTIERSEMVLDVGVNGRNHCYVSPYPLPTLCLVSERLCWKK